MYILRVLCGGMPCQRYYTEDNLRISWSHTRKHDLHERNASQNLSMEDCKYMASLIFVILSILVVVASLLVILQRNPIYSALYLVFTFFSMAGFPDPGSRIYRGHSGHCLCRGHHGVIPVCHNDVEPGDRH